MPSSKRRQNNVEKALRDSAKGQQNIKCAFKKLAARPAPVPDEIQPARENPTSQGSLTACPSTSEEDHSRPLSPVPIAVPSVEGESSDVEGESNPHKRKKSSNTRHKNGISSVLELNYPWILTALEPGEDGKFNTVLYCRLCKKHNTTEISGQGVWVKIGCKTLRKDCVKLHLHSEQHTRSLRKEVELENVDIQMNEMSKSKIVCVEAMLEIVLYLAKNNHALEEFSTLVDLSLKTGSKDLLPIRQSANATYKSPSAVHELLECLNCSLNEWLFPQFQASSTYGIILDEVTDSAKLKNLGIVIKFLDPMGVAQMKFLEVKEMARATGEAISEKVLQVLKEKSISSHKCSNLTSDGAASFSGKNVGAACRLKHEMGDIIVMHCHDHRLALATRNAFAEVKRIEQDLQRI